MLIWKNTEILGKYAEGLPFTSIKNEASIAIIGSKIINVSEFQNLKGIFRAGIGRDNVPVSEAKEKNIIIRYPSDNNTNILFEETASFTCNLCFKMFYHDLGSLDPWQKNIRKKLSEKKLLIIGLGRIGSRVAKLMGNFVQVFTFDILHNNISELKKLINTADCISIHIPKSDDNISFFDSEKLSWMKDGSILINTARAAIVDENALYKEIKNNRIKAAFDVLWTEPYNGIMKKFYPDNFFISPHVASASHEFSKSCRDDINQLIIDLNG